MQTSASRGINCHACRGVGLPDAGKMTPSWRMGASTKLGKPTKKRATGQRLRPKRLDGDFPGWSPWEVCPEWEDAPALLICWGGAGSGDARVGGVRRGAEGD